MTDASMFFRKTAFDLVRDTVCDSDVRLSAIADMIRHNLLTEVMAAGSGHLGTSLSGADILAVLYHDHLRVNPDKPFALDRDIFILSKGHAAPLAYATLASRGFFSDDSLLTFRRLNGLQGHVDITTPGIDANTGALGMGISKAKGHAIAMKKEGRDSRAFVMTGDGELQEGQNWEGLQSAPVHKLGNLVLLIDQNRVQTDQLVETILPMPPVEEKLHAFGWEIHVVDGHDVRDIRQTLEALNYENGVPKAIVCKTVKGKGISFMEHPEALKKDGMYHWHNKVPSEAQFAIAVSELRSRIASKLEGAELPQDFWPATPEQFDRSATTVAFADDYVVRGYARALQELIRHYRNIVVLDGDLAIDCGVKQVEIDTPDRFIELGIAEQDMVSVAGAMARRGFLPFVNTFSAFLSARSNEQIFNNQSEHSKVLYAGHLAGFIPATAGKSHQAVRDIGLMRTIPGLSICEPCNEDEAYQATYYAALEHTTSMYIRFANCRGLRDITLPPGYRFEKGKGCTLKQGNDVAIISAGPIMLTQALEAAEILESKGLHAKVINLPWHSDIDPAWLTETTRGIRNMIVVDNHVAVGGQSSAIRDLLPVSAELREKNLHNFSLEGFAETGQLFETLRRFRLDAQSIADRIQRILA